MNDFCLFEDKVEIKQMKYGCIPNIDLRDYKVRSNVAMSELPKEFCLQRKQKIKNQGSVYSCTAHAMSSILEYFDNGNHDLSTNFIYGFNDRNTHGMTLNEACKITQKYGDMLKCDCDGNYEIPKAHEEFLKVATDEDKLKRAYKFRIDSYFSCDTTKDIKFAIMNYGAVLASVKWYDEYHINKNGIISFNKTTNYGYHAVVVYGWNEYGFICQNSWGKTFGKNGTFILPYEDKIVECKAFVDHIDGDESLVTKKYNVFFDNLLKIVNLIINFITRWLFT